MEAMFLAGHLIKAQKFDEDRRPLRPTRESDKLGHSGVFSLAAMIAGTGLFAAVLDFVVR